ncbi:MAG: 4-(cytidine 5'-diphospho)-2-C-methyl-D-erythritol kinase [Clostridiales bacterium]|nr:4-(cytidine 5'-diphospho)-2-C-methyl-D-erythritol kinase [Clostridiales bacterium]
MRITRQAPAKVNLFLRMAGRREDGYHLLYSCMQTLSIYDELDLEVEPKKGGETSEVKFFSECDYLPDDPVKNTAVAAAMRFLERLAPEKYTVSVRLKKVIPSQAGLGGGSSDAAAVLLALDELFERRVSRSELHRIALSVGADVPFFLQGGTTLCEGVGEILTPMPSLSGIPMLLLKPENGVSTPYCYSVFDKLGTPLVTDTEKDRLKKDLQSSLEPLARVRAASPLWSNDLQNPAIGAVPEISEGLALLKEGGAVFSAMSGSGSAVFGLFDSGERIDEIIDSPRFLTLMDQGWWAGKAKTL